jgi:hypothetical protein
MADGYNMVGWVDTLGIVEQLQNIHRLSQSTEPSAVSGLVSALHSSFPLARRKASRGLLEKAMTAPVSNQQQMLAVLSPSSGNLDHTDPVVQKNLIRALASLSLPEATATLRQFFQQSSITAQLNGVEALAQTHRERLGIVAAATPYPQVRQAVNLLGQ